MKQAIMDNQKKQSADVADRADVRRKKTVISSSVSSVSSVDRSLRRGNTIVLVTGILVLLVIIATAYITRTQAGRVSAIAYQGHGYRQNNAEIIADELANEIAQSLFVRDTFKTTPLDSNGPRKLPAANAVRYGVQLVDLANQNPFNFAPYHVVPWTNWPDLGFGINPKQWPKGEGNPDTPPAGPLPPSDLFIRAVLAGEDNPHGNPGIGDTRWLRDLEPLRWDTWNIFANGGNGGLVPPNPPDGIPDSYSHWRHLSNIARPDNAWRIVRNIDDVGGPTGFLLTDLSIPVEQWLPMRPDISRFSTTGDPIFPGQAMFETQWCRWFGADPTCVNPTTTAARLFNHATIMLDPFNVPHNFYRLSDLNGNGIRHEIGERPQDEFIIGTPRWNVCRVLVDTDGDGYTDAFWFLAPTSSQSGIRQLVAISIIDNSGMLSTNVATRFMRDDSGNPQNTVKKTAGLIPPDLALVGQLATNDLPGVAGNHSGNYNVGFYDNADHHYLVNATAEPDPIPPSGGSDFHKFDYYTALDLATAAGYPQPWQRHMLEMGFTQITGAVSGQNHPTQGARLDFWRRGASRLLTPDAQSGYSPYTTGDELELRMYAGNNSPWTFSRFEYATQPVNSTVFQRFLRANTTFEESNEYVEQRGNRKKLIDPRQRLTTINATRNDLAPPWLLENPNAVDVRYRRKLDLRSLDLANTIDWDGVGGITLADAVLRLRDTFERCFIDLSLADIVAGTYGMPGTYFGKDAANSNVLLRKTRQMSAAFAANLWQWRDDNYLSPVLGVQSEAIVERGPVFGDQYKYMGMEPQPFLVEVYIGHVYKSIQVPNADADGDEYGNAGNNIILDGPGQSRRSTVVAVQIANPFNVPIDLSNYMITVFGQPLVLSDAVVIDDQNPDNPNPTAARLILAPGTDEYPTTAIYYSIHKDLIGPQVPPAADTKWKNFLDIDPANHPATTIIASPRHAPISPPANPLNIPWSQDRSEYDGAIGEAVELRRLDPNGSPTVLNDWIVIDRIDPRTDRDFGDAVNALDLTRPDAEPTTPPDVQPGDPYPVGIDIGPPQLTSGGSTVPGYDHWVQWVRATRAWGIDLNQNSFVETNPAANGYAANNYSIHRFRYDPNERSPRFVFSDRVVVTPAGTAVSSVDTDGRTFIASGNRYKFVAHPDGEGGDFDNNGAPDDGIPARPTPPRPWFTRSYRMANNVVVPDMPPALQEPPTTPNPPNSQLAPRKPTFFDMNRGRNDAAFAAPAGTYYATYFPDGSSYPDKGWYTQGDSVDDQVFDNSVTPPNLHVRMRFPMQMLQKDADFEQVGELFNIWLFGHELKSSDNSTNRTFSEFMAEEVDDLLPDPADFAALPQPVQLAIVESLPRVNRLRATPAVGETGVYGQVVGVVRGACCVNGACVPDVTASDCAALNGTWYGSGSTCLPSPCATAPLPNMTDPRYSMPALPAGVRVMDAFVCDGAGLVIRDVTGPTVGVPDGTIDGRDAEFQRLHNAKRFDGSATPGMVNINTASPEVLRALPHWYRLVHEFGRPRLPNGNLNMSDIFYNAVFDPTGNPLQPLVTEPSAATAASALLPRTLLPEAMVQYREGLNGYNALGACSFVASCVNNVTADDCAFAGGTWRGENSTCNPTTWIAAGQADSTVYTGFGTGPNYERRRELARRPDYNPTQATIATVAQSNWIRGDRGFASIGETLLLSRGGSAPSSNTVPYATMRPTANPAVPDVLYNQYWRADMGVTPRHGVATPLGAMPFWGLYAAGVAYQSPVDISTDRASSYDPFNSTIGNTIPASTINYRPDPVAGDAEEANVLVAGASNIITTRSDTFTVYFRIRSFRQNTSVNPPVWDATNPEYIVDDSRYVMLVDRSSVNKPGDKPRILYLEKLPN